jgi:hypothetical protein
LPDNCQTDSEKDLYLNDIYKHENITLDRNKIRKNPALRQLAKLNLNSLYGKFGEHSNRTQTLIISEHSDLLSLLARLQTDIEDLNVTVLSNEKLMATFKYKTEYSPDLNTVNVALASFITSYARLELYKHLRLLGKDICYFDTDCGIYIERPGSYRIPNGKYLGNFTCELSKYGPGAYISEAIFCGAKNYCYEITVPGQEKKIYECRVRGFTLNYRNAARINFETMKKMLFNEIQKIDTVNHSIRSNKSSEIYSINESKIYSMVYNKRWRDPENPFETFPFGF